MDTKTDSRGIEYLDPGATLEQLPAGWALCGTCGRAWNDATPTAWTPAPAARCPFEEYHTDADSDPGPIPFYVLPAPNDVAATVFDPADETFGPILAAIAAGNFGTAAAALLELEART